MGKNDRILTPKGAYATLKSLKGRLSGFNDEYVARLFHYSHRITKKDIIFGSFDKSGRTWVRFFIAAYISRYYDLGIDVNWTNYIQLAPGTLFKKEALLLFPTRKIVKPIFSHRRTIGRYFPGRKVVYITRNMLDILVSFYFYHKHRRWYDYNDVDVNEFVANRFDLDEAINRINYFSTQLRKAREFFLLPYEALRKEPETKFEELIMFTGYGYNEAVFHEALERSSFRSMQQMELGVSQSDSTEKLHVRQGGIYTYADYLNKDVICFVLDQLEQKLNGILKPFYIPPKESIDRPTLSGTN
jgi:hypothetical protein